MTWITKPHALSQVLSAALYNMIIGMHQRWWQKFSGEGADLDFSASGKALAIAADHFKRMVFRALDYLPPAEVSFADYGRAIIAADQASHPDDDQERQFIRGEFVKRGIVTSPKALDVETDFEHAAVKELDLAALVSSDAVAADFANRNRDLLHIPDGALFQVAPRLDVTKLYYHRDGQKQRVRERLLKVRWTQFEPNPIGRGWPQTREIFTWARRSPSTGRPSAVAVLTTDPLPTASGGQEPTDGSNLFLQRLADTSLMQTGKPTSGPDGKPLPSVVQVDTSDGVMRVRSTGGLLHMDIEA